MKKKRWLFLLPLICGGMLFGNSITIRAEEGINVGSFIISGGIKDTDYSYAGGILTILSSETLTIKNKDINTPATDRILVPEKVKANLVFAGVNIKTNSNSPFTLTPDSDGDGKGASAQIILADNTTNTLVSNSTYYPGLRSGKTTSLIIDDAIVNEDINGNAIIPELGRIPNDVTLSNGTKLNKGDRLTLLDSKNAGTLNVTGSNYAAGIGGGDGEDGGNITINGGVIKATGIGTGDGIENGGAGIGGGNYAAGGNIVINGGTITAQGAYHAAGIGGGYATRYASAPQPLTPAVVDAGTGKAKSGNITINGGLTYSNGGAHGDAFGDGCVGSTTTDQYKIIVTGGTIIPTAVSGRYDLGGSQADVFVLGGSLSASRFSSKGGAVAYGDMDKTTQVFMTKITLNSWGTDKVGTTLVDDMEMKINGINYNYGVPSYTDANGVLYFWLPDTNKGAEVSIDLDIIDKTTNTIVNTDTFFAKDVGNGSNTFLKQYINFDIGNENMPNGLITKRYNGLGLNDEEIKNIVAGLNLATTIPTGGVLNDASQMTISSQLLKSDGITPEDNAEITDGSNADGGKYQLIITSTQYANSALQNFKDSYWGHRTYFKYAEITPADTESILSIEGLSSEPDTFRPDKVLTLKAKVKPADGEGLACASPKGSVQFYINGKKYREPVELTAQAKENDSSYNYSTASIEWNPLTDSYCTEKEIQNISFEYIGEDPNYTYGTQDEINLKLDKLNIDVDGDGIPDINIDTDHDGKPDINIDLNNDWKPEINLDTDNTGNWKPSSEGGNADGIWKPDTSIDTNGDGKGNSDYYRPAIDLDKDGVDDNWKPNTEVATDTIDYETSNPNINIDTNGDGKPDVNIDTNGDGKPDTNIDTDGDNIPDINIDVDGDGVPDINIDTDGDGKPDINIDMNGDKKPDINIDTDNTGIWKPSSEGGNKDHVWKPDTSIDTNGDGKGDSDYYRPVIDVDKDGVDDNWKPNKDVTTDTIDYETGNPNINIDIDGDGIPDINIDTNKDGKPDINIDTNGDNIPDINIDTNGDGKPNINIDTNGDGKPDINIDTNGDGKPDINIDTNGDQKPDTNIDVDGDGVPDLNIDTDQDGKPDINIDTDGDGLPDINIDTDNTGIWKPSSEGGNKDKIWKPDTNIDTNGDGIGDSSYYRPAIDLDKDGVDDNWNPSIDVNNGSIIYDTWNPNINIDTNGDGKPDINIDIDGDGIPDLNIDTNGDNIADLNIDVNEDELPEINIDSNNDGEVDILIKGIDTGDQNTIMSYAFFLLVSGIGFLYAKKIKYDEDTE